MFPHSDFMELPDGSPMVETTGEVLERYFHTKVLRCPIVSSPRIETIRG